MKSHAWIGPTILSHSPPSLSCLTLSHAHALFARDKTRELQRTTNLFTEVSFMSPIKILFKRKAFKNHLGHKWGRRYLKKAEALNGCNSFYFCLLFSGSSAARDLSLVLTPPICFRSLPPNVGNESIKMSSHELVQVLSTYSMQKWDYLHNKNLPSSF